MYQRVITILLLIICLSIQVFADEGFRVIDQGKTEFSVDLGTFDNCRPHTIEKYIRNYLHRDNQGGYFLIKQYFETGTGCFEGYRPQDISVSAYVVNRLGTINQNPIWRFKTTGIRGVVGQYPFSGLYIVEEVGCCGAGTIHRYYSLNTGNLLAYSSVELLAVDLALTRERRFIGVEDNITTSQSYSGNHIAIIFYSDVNHIKQKLAVVKHDDNEEWAVDKVELSEGRLNNRQITIYRQKEFSKFNISISLWCRCEANPIIISIPVFADRLDIDSVTIKGNSKTRVLNLDHNNGVNPMR